jgi:hypothetical protein
MCWKVVCGLVGNLALLVCCDPLVSTCYPCVMGVLQSISSSFHKMVAL